MHDLIEEFIRGVGTVMGVGQPLLGVGFIMINDLEVAEQGSGINKVL